MKSPQRHGYPAMTADVPKQLDQDFDELIRTGYSSSFARAIVEAHESGYFAAITAIANNPPADQNMFRDYDARFDDAYTETSIRK